MLIADDGLSGSALALKLLVEPLQSRTDTRILIAKAMHQLYEEGIGMAGASAGGQHCFGTLRPSAPDTKQPIGQGIGRFAAGAAIDHPGRDPL